jgi:hypothetical protein
MDVNFYSVYDAAMGRYADPFCAPTNEVALRAFKAYIERNPDIKENAADYTLFGVGAFSPETGTVQPFTAPVRLIGVMELLSIADPTPQEAMFPPSSEA